MFHLGTKSPIVVSRRSRRWLALIATAVLLACGGRIDGVTESGDTTSPIPVAPGSRSLPNVRSGGGQTIKAPRLVPVFFGNDPREAELSKFFGELAGSDYWKQTTAEYGVGDLTTGPAIHAEGSLPPTMTELEIRQWFISRFNGKTEFGAVDAPSSIYTIFLEPHTVIKAPWGTSCVSFHAYHGEAVVQGQRAVYAIIPRCNTKAEAELDALTRSVTHELIETATDPFVDSRPAYGFPDERGLGWVLGAGSELTDMCVFEPGAYGNLVGGRSVARSWSNREASAGHDPCVPAVPGPYYNAEPVLPETASFKLGGGKMNAKSIKVPVGESRTVEVFPFADGPVDSWTMDAQDEVELFGGKPELELTFDDATARPGEVRHLTIKRLSPSAAGMTAFVIFSHVGTQGHHWWGVVGN